MTARINKIQSIKENIETALKQADIIADNYKKISDTIKKETESWISFCKNLENQWAPVLISLEKLLSYNSEKIAKNA